MREDCSVQYQATANTVISPEPLISSQADAASRVATKGNGEERNLPDAPPWRMGLAAPEGPIESNEQSSRRHSVVGGGRAPTCVHVRHRNSRRVHRPW